MAAATSTIRTSTSSSSDRRGDAGVLRYQRATTKTYRRVYRNLQSVAAPGKYTADSIAATAAVWDPANALTSNNAADLAVPGPDPVQHREVWVCPPR